MNNFNAFEIRYNGGLNIDEIDNPHSKSDAINDYDIAYTPSVKRLTLVNKEDQTLNDQVIFTNLATLTDVSNAEREYDLSYDTTNLKLFENGVLKDTENLTEKQELKIVGENQGFRFVNQANKSYIEVGENQSPNSGGNLFIGKYQTAINPTARFDTVNRRAYLFNNVFLGGEDNSVNAIEIFKNSNEFFIQPSNDVTNKPIRFANSFKSTYDTNVTQYLGNIDMNNNDISNVNNLWINNVNSTNDASINFNNSIVVSGVNNIKSNTIFVGDKKMTDNGSRIAVDELNNVAYLADIHNPPTQRKQYYKPTLPYKGAVSNTYFGNSCKIKKGLNPIGLSVSGTPPTTSAFGESVLLTLPNSNPNDLKYKITHKFMFWNNYFAITSPVASLNKAIMPSDGSGFWNLYFKKDIGNGVTTSIFYLTPYYVEYNPSQPTPYLSSWKPLCKQNYETVVGDLNPKIVNFEAQGEQNITEFLIDYDNIVDEAKGKKIYISIFAYYQAFQPIGGDYPLLGWYIKNSNFDFQIINNSNDEIDHQLDLSNVMLFYDSNNPIKSYETISFSGNDFGARETARSKFFHLKNENSLELFDTHTDNSLNHSIEKFIGNQININLTNIPNIKLNQLYDLGIIFKSIDGSGDMRWKITLTDNSINTYDFSINDYNDNFENDGKWRIVDNTFLNYDFEDFDVDISNIELEIDASLRVIFDEINLTWTDLSNVLYDKYYYFKKTDFNRNLLTHFQNPFNNEIILRDDINYGGGESPSNYSQSIKFKGDYYSGFGSTYEITDLAEIKTNYANTNISDSGVQGQGKLSFLVSENNISTVQPPVEKLNIQPNKVQLNTDLDLSGNDINNVNQILNIGHPNENWDLLVDSGNNRLNFKAKQTKNLFQIMGSTGRRLAVFDTDVNNETITFFPDLFTGKTFQFIINSGIIMNRSDDINMNNGDINNVGAVNMSSGGNIDMNNGDINSINTAIITNKLGIGISNPERALHIRDDIPRIDRDSTVAFILAKYNSGYSSIQKSFIFGVEGGVSSFNDGYFFIGDYGTSVSGSFNERFRIENNGVVTITDNDLDLNTNDINNVGGINMTSGGDIDMNGGDINDLQTLNSKLILSVGGNQRNKLLILNDPSMEFSLVNNTNSQPNNFINGASLTVGRENNGLHFGLDGIANNRRAYIQVGHENGNFASSSGDLFLQPFNTASGIKIGGGTSTEPTEKLDIEGNITMNGNNINNVGALNMSSSGDIDMNSGDISNVSVINMSNAADINNVNDLNFNSLGTINTVNRINFSGVGANITTGTGDTLNITDPTISNSRLLITGTKSTFNTNISINDNEIQNFRMGYLLVNNDISLTNQYTVIDCDNSNNAMTVQLPTKTNGKIFKIMIRFEGTGNDVTLTASGGELFYTNVDPTGTSQLVLDDQHSNNTKTIKSIELVGFRLGWMVLRQDTT